jgi:hypothetical protein
LLAAVLLAMICIKAYIGSSVASVLIKESSINMSLKSLKQWLTNANGWQRIWFVSSVVCFLYFITIFPLSEINRGGSFRYERLWAAEREMKNPMCALYMSEEISKLVEPKYTTDGSTCYHIYSHRVFSDDKKPITEAIYQERFSSNENKMWLKNIGIGCIVAFFLTAFVYLVGVVTFWIIKGFKKRELK